MYNGSLYMVHTKWDKLFWCSFLLVLVFRLFLSFYYFLIFLFRILFSVDRVEISYRVAYSRSQAYIHMAFGWTWKKMQHEFLQRN